MSVTVYRQGRLRIKIHHQDHGSPHVHVYGSGAEAKIYLNTFTIDRSEGFNKPTLNGIVKLIRKKNARFLEKWNEVNGPEEDEE